MTWIEAMWAEVDNMSPLDQFVICGEWITTMQQELVPALAQRRREKLVEASEENENDYLRLAELIGSRRATVERLVNEGRSRMREKAQHQPS